MFTKQQRVARTTVGALAAAALLVAHPAMADGWPDTVEGEWQVIGNHHAGTLLIRQHPGPGQCKPISGEIYEVDAIEGFYCPDSGRIGFLRYSGKGFPFPKQWWVGNVSQFLRGRPLRLGGVFGAPVHNNVVGTTGGSLGEYNFQAEK